MNNIREWITYEHRPKAAVIAAVLTSLLSAALIGDLAGVIEAWQNTAPILASLVVSVIIAWLFGAQAEKGTTRWAPEDMLDGHDVLSTVDDPEDDDGIEDTYGRDLG